MPSAMAAAAPELGELLREVPVGVFFRR